MTTIQKGDIALQRVILRAFERGFTVSKPCHEGARYDLVLDDGARLFRVQVKYCTGCADGRYTLHLSKHTGGYNRRLYLYRPEEVDALVAYLSPLDRCLWLPPELFAHRHQVAFRTRPARNGQTRRVNFVEAYLW